MQPLGSPPTKRNSHHLWTESELPSLPNPHHSLLSRPGVLTPLRCLSGSCSLRARVSHLRGKGKESKRKPDAPRATVSVLPDLPSQLPFREGKPEWHSLDSSPRSTSLKSRKGAEAEALCAAWSWTPEGDGDLQSPCPLPGVPGEGGAGVQRGEPRIPQLQRERYRRKVGRGV